MHSGNDGSQSVDPSVTDRVGGGGASSESLWPFASGFAPFAASRSIGNHPEDRQCRRAERSLGCDPRTVDPARPLSKLPLGGGSSAAGDGDVDGLRPGAAARGRGWLIRDHRAGGSSGAGGVPT